MRGGPGGQGMMRGRGRGGFQPGRPQPGKKETLKFDDDYDFEKANDQFKEIVDKLSKTKIEGEEGQEETVVGEEEAVEIEVVEGEEGEIPEGDDEIFYDKKKSFFDNISCEALEREKGNMVRNDWKAEKKLNKETFGVAGNRNFGGGYRGGRGGYYNNRGGRGGMGYNQNRGGGGGYGRIGGQPMGGRGGYRGGYNNGGGYHDGGYNGGYNNRGRGGYGGQRGGYGGGIRAGGDGMGGGHRGGYAAAVRGGGPGQGK